MDWFDEVDLYCERIGPGLWAEPLNAISNLAFLIAAGLLLSRLLADERRDWAAVVFAALVGVMGIGSGLFHMFANRWSLMADVVPIQLFILGYFFLAMVRFLALGGLAALMATLAFFLVSRPLARLLEPLIGGSSGYLPGLLAILIVAALARARAPHAARMLAWAGATFAVSLALRTLDQPLCPGLTVGTHFAWHVLNAVTLAILVLAAARARQPAGSAG